MRGVAIRVEGLSKQYRIGGKREAYRTLRDTVADTFMCPFRRAGRLLHGRAARVAPQDETIWALKDVSFEIKHGEVLGIIGRNGAGKSTLLKVLARITRPTSGRVEIRGRVGSLLEVGTGFHSELTGRENTYLNGAILGMRKREVDRKFDAIVAFAELHRFIDTPVKHYSTGMFMRLAFAVAAHLEPDILLVDEVLAVGDLEFQKRCLGKMEEVTREEGRTIVFVSHNMGAIQQLCSSCLYLDRSRVVMHDTAGAAVAAYVARAAAGATDGAVTESHRVRGSREALIRRVVVGPSLDAPQDAFIVHEPIGIHFDYEVVAGARPLSFWILVAQPSGGAVVLNALQKDTGHLVAPGPGRHRLSVTLTAPGLMPGRYSVSAGIFAHDLLDRHDFADWVEQVASVDVLPAFRDGRPFDQRMGLVTTPAVWEPVA